MWTVSVWSLSGDEFRAGNYCASVLVLSDEGDEYWPAELLNWSHSQKHEVMARSEPIMMVSVGIIVNLFISNSVFERNYAFIQKGHIKLKKWQNIYGLIY